MQPQIYLSDLKKVLTRTQQDILDQFVRYGLRLKEIFLAQKSIAADLGCSVSSVTKFLQLVVELGWIEIGKLPGRAGHWQHNTYRLVGDLGDYVVQRKQRAIDKAVAAAERATQWAQRLARKWANNRVAEAVKLQLDAYKAEIVGRKSKSCRKGVASVPHVSFTNNSCSFSKVLKEKPVVSTVAVGQTAFLKDYEGQSSEDRERVRALIVKMRRRPSD